MNQANPFPTPPTITTTLTIEGMTCGNCLRHVRETLLALDGVSDAAVNLRGQSASVQHDPTRVDATALAAAISEVGYPAVPWQP